MLLYLQNKTSGFCIQSFVKENHETIKKEGAEGILTKQNDEKCSI